MDAQDFRSIQEAYLGVYIQEEVDLWVSDIIEEGYDIDEYTDEELLEAFLDERKNEDPKGVANKAGVNKPDAWGAPTKYGQEATRNSLAAGMKGVRTLQRAGVRINRHHRNKYLAHKVHQGWSKSAKESEHQTPEQKERRSKLIKPDLMTFRKDLPKHERDKDVPFVRKAERAVNKKGEFASDNEPQPTARQQRLKKLQAAQRERNQEKGVSENYDLYDIVLEHLLDEGYADTNDSAIAIMANMSEEWRDEIVEEVLDEARRADKLGHERGTAANPNRNDTPYSDPSQRTTLHSRLKRRADEMGRERRNSPRYKQGGRPPLSKKEKAFLQASDRTSPGRGHVRSPNVPDTGSHAEWPSERRAQRDPRQNPKHNANK